MEHTSRRLDFNDDALLLLPEPPAYLPPATLEVKSHTLYRYNDYRWDGFVSDCKVIKLTKGYFTFVEFEDLEKLSALKYLRARVDTCPYTGKVVKVRALGEIGRKKYYLHRFLMDARKHDIIDHFNHHPLDNRRRRNLLNTSQGANLAHARRDSKTGLLRGVELRGNKFGGKIQFEGIKYRSKEMWNEQESAHEWYLAKHKELYGYTDTEGLPMVRSYPIFPPRIDEDKETYVPY